MEWWVTRGGQKPIGPVSTELLLQGIRARMVPGDSLVCEVGGTHWKSIDGVPALSAAVGEAQAGVSDSEVGPRESQPTLTEELWDAFDDPDEQTMVDRAPGARSNPPAPPLSADFDDPGENTVVDRSPLRSSLPPKR